MEILKIVISGIVFIFLFKFIKIWVSAVRAIVKKETWEFNYTFPWAKLNSK